MDLTKLNTPGREFAEAVLADLASREMHLDPVDERLLMEAARITDALARVERKLRDDGMLLTNKVSGAVKGHPLLAERRGLRGDLVRVLSRLDLSDPPEETATGGPTGVVQPYRSAQKAAAGRSSGRSARR